MRRRHKDVDALTALRSIFVSMIHASIAIVIVTAAIAPDPQEVDSSIPTAAFAAGVIVFGIVGLVLVRTAQRKPLATSDARELAGSYNTSFFLGISMAQSNFLMGFVGVFVTGELWLIIVGIPLAVIGFALSAPTAANLARRQHEINMQGSTLSLVDVLMSTRLGVQPEKS